MQTMLLTAGEILFTSCETITIAICLLSCCRMLYNSFSNCLSMKLVGSSRINNFGSEITARQSNVRCICPPDISPICRSEIALIPILSSSCIALVLSARLYLVANPRSLCRPDITTSRTEIGKLRSKVECCGRYPISRLLPLKRVGDSRTSPLCGSVPKIALIRVVLPPPFGPIMQIKSSAKISKFTLSIAT